MKKKQIAVVVTVVFLVLGAALFSGIFFLVSVGKDGRIPEGEAHRPESQTMPENGKKTAISPRPRENAMVPLQDSLPKMQNEKDVHSVPGADADEYLNEKGQLVRVRVSEEGGLKYSRIRSEETYPGNKNEGEPLSKVEMAADHLLVKFSGELSDEEVSASLKALGMKIMSRKQLSGIYLVSFDDLGKDSFREAIAKLAKLRGVKHAGPDYLVRPEEDFSTISGAGPVQNDNDNCLLSGGDANKRGRVLKNTLF